MLTRLIISECETFFRTRSQIVNLSSIDRTTLFRFELESMLSNWLSTIQRKDLQLCDAKKKWEKKIKNIAS